MKAHEKAYHVCVGAPRPAQPIVMIFGAARDLTDMINRAKFNIDRFKGFGIAKGQIWGSPIRNRNGQYHFVLHCRARA